MPWRDCHSPCLQASVTVPDGKNQDLVNTRWRSLVAGVNFDSPGMGMIVSFFGRRPKPAAKPLHHNGSVWAEADRLELEHGREGAIASVRERIARADRAHRRRLYELHDELARRTGPERRVG
jgi:hypothetical protein